MTKKGFNLLDQNKFPSFGQNSFAVNRYEWEKTFLRSKHLWKYLCISKCYVKLQTYEWENSRPNWLEGLELYTLKGPDHSLGKSINYLDSIFDENTGHIWLTFKHLKKKTDAWNDIVFNKILKMGAYISTLGLNPK